MDSYLMVLGLDFMPGFGFSSYSLKDWLQFAAAVLAIAVSSYGWWKALQYSKARIAERLKEYLDRQEKNIGEVRHLIVPHLRNGRAISQTPTVEIHKCIEGAIRLAQRRDHENAEGQLRAFVISLTNDAEVGRRHWEVARKQAATVLVFAGLIAQKRGDIPSAQTAWTQALEHNPQDPEAIRCLGELDLMAGRSDEAFERFAQATGLAPDDKLLRAETQSLKADFYRRTAAPKRERDDLRDSARHFEDAGEHQRAGEAYERAAEIEVQLGFVRQAPETLKRAHRAFHTAEDHRANQVRERLSEMGEDVSNVPILEEPSKWPAIPWPWVRLSIEVLILGTVVYVAFMR